MRTTLTHLLLAPMVLLACQGGAGDGPSREAAPAAGSQDAHVTGEVIYRQRSALPPDAEIEVVLEDVSRADAPSTTLGRQTIRAEGRQVPIPFDVTYDASVIDPRSRIGLRARITSGGELLFLSQEHFGAVTQGNPTSGLVVMVAPP